MGARGPLGTDRQQDWTQHNSSVPQEHCLARGGAGDLEWPEAAARWRGGHSKHTLTGPPSEMGVATNNPGIERLLTPAHLQLHEPVANKDNVSQ